MIHSDTRLALEVVVDTGVQKRRDYGFVADAAGRDEGQPLQVGLGRGHRKGQGIVTHLEMLLGL